MKTTTLQPALTGEKKKMKQAEELMHKFALLNRSRKDLIDTIIDELTGYEKEIKATEAKLVEIGEDFRKAGKLNYDADGNIHFDDGYLHIEKKTVVVTSKKFTFAEFLAVHPEMVSYDLKVKPIKDAVLNQDLNKELKKLGVSTDTKEKVQVLLAKDNTGREAKE